MGKSQFSIGNTSSNGGVSIVMLVFWGVYQIWAPGVPGTFFRFYQRLWCYHQCMSSTVAFDSFLVALGGSRRNSSRQCGNGSTKVLDNISCRRGAALEVIELETYSGLKF